VIKKEQLLIEEAEKEIIERSEVKDDEVVKVIEKIEEEDLIDIFNSRQFPIILFILVNLEISNKNLLQMQGRSHSHY